MSPVVGVGQHEFEHPTHPEPGEVPGRSRDAAAPAGTGQSLAVLHGVQPADLRQRRRLGGRGHQASYECFHWSRLCGHLRGRGKGYELNIFMDSQIWDFRANNQ